MAPGLFLTRPHTLTVAGAAQEWADQELSGCASLTLPFQWSVSAVTCFPFHQGAGNALLAPVTSAAIVAAMRLEIVLLSGPRIYIDNETLNLDLTGFSKL